jgi:uncharacterized cupin superfamily protein
MKVTSSNSQPWKDALTRGNYGQRTKPLDTGKGARLGCSVWELAPGKKSFPFHAHHVTEEAMFVLSGHAQVRTPEGLTAVGPGDFVSFPAGGSAHQLVNDGVEPFVYLGVSSGMGVDVVEYPDSKKVASAVGRPPDGRRYVFRQADQADYFADDPDA